MIEKTLVLIKPDGVQRGLIGKVIERFENVGLKIIALKMVHIDDELARKHYNQDIEARRGKHVRDWLIEFIISAPVVAIALEGIEAVSLVRKLVGDTEPKSAAPGTIRGDLSQVSYSYADLVKRSIKNVIHASSNKEDAEYEIGLWFNKDELFNYKNIHEQHLS